MDKFTTLTGVGAPLPMINVDTDMIVLNRPACKNAQILAAGENAQFRRDRRPQRRVR